MELFRFSSCLTNTNESPTAFVVENEAFAAVGNYDSIKEQYPNAKVTDYSGYTILPGFNDCHCHIAPLGFELRRAKLSDTNITSMDNLILCLKNWEIDNPTAEWIEGSRYHHDRMIEKRHPDRYDLDKVSKVKPIYITHASGHSAVTNSKGLELAGIDRNRKDPAGGIIEHDENGEPTGRLFEYAMDIPRKAMKAPGVDAVIHAIHRAANHMASLGITSATDATARNLTEIHAYQKCAEMGLPMSIGVMPSYSVVHTSKGITPRDEFIASLGFSLIKIGPVKLFADGAITTRTASLDEPFADQDHCGELIYGEKELHRRIALIHKAGHSIAIHAIGDRAIRIAFSGLNSAMHEFPNNNILHRIEHGMIMPDFMLKQIAESGIAMCMQPEFIHTFGDAYIKALGMERTYNINRYQSIMKAGIPLGFSSDAPVTTGDPFIGIQSAVNRITANGIQLSKDESLDYPSAIRAYTFGSSEISGTATSLGKIAKGFQADFIVINNHNLSLDWSEWNSAKLQAVYAKGNLIHSI